MLGLTEGIDEVWCLGYAESGLVGKTLRLIFVATRCTERKDQRMFDRYVRVLLLLPQGLGLLDEASSVLAQTFDPCMLAGRGHIVCK